MDKTKTCEGCAWVSRDGYCASGDVAPYKPKEICDKFAPAKPIN